MAEEAVVRFRERPGSYLPRSAFPSTLGGTFREEWAVARAGGGARRISGPVVGV